jgi:gluconokinase
MNAPPVVEPVVLVLMGVSGSGKSTVAALVAGRLGWDFEEGDDLHSPANIARMHAGHPLDDEDRMPWLAEVAAWIQERTDADRPGIITCSALKRSYRDVLRGEHVIFVHVAGSQEEIAARLASRHGHYMASSLLESQFATLEPPAPDERSITVDINTSAAQEAAEIVKVLGLIPDGATAGPR